MQLPCMAASLVFRAADVGLVGHGGDLLHLNFLDVVKRLKVVEGVVLEVADLLEFVIVEVEVAFLVALDLKVVEHLLKWTLLELGHVVLLDKHVLGGDVHEVGLQDGQHVEGDRQAVVQVLTDFDGLTQDYVDFVVDLAHQAPQVAVVVDVLVGRVYQRLEALQVQLVDQLLLLLQH
eukprot:CAMPEP_0116984716 /NCGR_PEP_ID=MMETSP0467-20121206/61786_1 /TAXON_ID=283647 /ORGANISM="Mesodinium pulex, Strain SPMC105" /LENGTH=176 /DNA_ID=CAMNT_0004679817 /DNA_START=640 /DNA_END=1169 /DNA_ORIENTATION=-